MTGHWFLDHLWLVPLLPFLGFLWVGLANFLPPRVAGWTAIAAMGGSLVVGWGAALEYFSSMGGQSLVVFEYDWLRFSDTLVGRVGLLVDDISMLLVLVVTNVGFFIHVYSQGYMHGDKGYRRFFAFMNLFSFSMLGLVLSSSLLQIFIFWELVGVSSFLLIGFYWEKPSAVAACKKAFIVTRFADLGFLIGLLVVSYYAGGFDFTYLNDAQTIDRLAAARMPWLGLSILPLSAVLIYMGAAGKSAMFPLHIWLPDAMEGPTPVSALIHAATMVVAGVYLVARLFPLFAASETGLATVMVVGTLTSLFAAIIAVTQHDIKRVLAYSTLSQLGYMMLALGVASWEHPLGFTASMFHLTTHACFKALLFLGAGSVIHAVHTNDLREMGGLRSKLPITHATFLVACLAISGVPPFSGFFSKDEILAAALGSGHYAVFGVAFLVAGLTAFYMFRLYFMAFWAKPADSGAAAKAHESPASMWVPLVVLAVPSVAAGWLPFGEWVHRGSLEHHGMNLAVAIPAIAMGLLGIAVAFVLYFRENYLPSQLAYAFGKIYDVVHHKFYVDELYQFITHRIIFRRVSAPLNWVDRHGVDGFMDLTAQAIRRSGAWMRKAVTGRIQTYLLWVAGGVLLLIPLLWGMGKGVGGALGIFAAGLLVFTYIWQLVLQLRRKSEPLKHIERD